MKFFCQMLLLPSFIFAQSIVAQTVPSPSPASPTVQSQPVAHTPTSEQIAHMETMLEDWPDLARYRNENAALPAPAPGESRVVFMGDSITDLWGHGAAFFPGKPYINRGISGQTTPQMLIRFRSDVIALKPKVVVILAGTNDIAGNTGPSTLQMTEDNLTSMAELARANHIRVIMASVLPAANYPWRPGVESIEPIRALNRWIQNYCAANGCVYLDYYSVMVDPAFALKKEFTEDGVHPNAAGYAVMAPSAEKAIVDALHSK